MYINMKTAETKTLRQIRAEHPNLSLPRTPKPEQLRAIGYADVLDGDYPAGDVVEKGAIAQHEDGKFYQEFTSRDRTPEEEDRRLKAIANLGSLTATARTIPADGETSSTVKYGSDDTEEVFVVDGEVVVVPVVDYIAALDIAADAPGPIVVEVRGQSITIVAGTIEGHVGAESCIKTIVTPGKARKALEVLAQIVLRENRESLTPEQSAALFALNSKKEAK